MTPNTLFWAALVGGGGGGGGKMGKVLAVEQLSEEGVEQSPGHPLPRSDHMLNHRAGKRLRGGGGGC